MGQGGHPKMAAGHEGAQPAQNLAPLSLPRSLPGVVQPRITGPMAFIPYVPTENAAGLLARLYAEYSDADGALDNILRIHALNPRSLKDHVQLYSHLMRGPSPLSRVQREMIAVTVSAENDCFY